MQADLSYGSEPEDEGLRSALDDAALPALRGALYPPEIVRQIAPVVSDWLGTRCKAQLLEHRLVRHKPGRRCVIYYVLDAGRRIGIYAKMRARGPDRRTQKLLGALERAGLDHARGSRIGVPRAVGVVPELGLTLQSECPGVVPTQRMEHPDAIRVMEQVAEALATLHHASVSTSRTHTMDDELEILRSGLSRVADDLPHRRKRIDAVLAECERVARGVEPSMRCGLHRDFHPDQILVDGDRMSLLDLDLYAVGDPALDVGNFSAHLTELSIRCHGRPDRFADLERRFEARYRTLFPAVSLHAIRVYRTLTLARHIRLSTVIAGRSGSTDALLDHCERELANGMC